MKKIIVILILLLLTGCTVKYNIEFENDKVNENFTVYVDNSSESVSIDYLTNNDFYAYINPEMIKYKKTIKKSNDITKFNYLYSYNIDEYKNSMALSSCFKAYNIIKEEDYYLFSTSTGVKCMTSDASTIIDNLDIVIVSNHKLIETNADEIHDYKYVWHINKDNYESKSVNLKLYQNKYIFNYKHKFTNTILVIVFVGIVILLPIISLKIRRKRINKI